ncbi:MAG: hypothetical protein R3B91_10005 [Planctomycetaceae bacterium]
MRTSSIECKQPFEITAVDARFLTVQNCGELRLLEFEFAFVRYGDTDGGESIGFPSRPGTTSSKVERTELRMLVTFLLPSRMPPVPLAESN